jgi:hypothetical protein
LRAALAHHAGQRHAWRGGGWVGGVRGKVGEVGAVQGGGGVLSDKAMVYTWRRGEPAAYTITPRMMPGVSA